MIPFSHSWPFLVGWPVAAMLLHMKLLRPKYLEPWLSRRLHNQFLALYEANWRPRMFRHLHAMAVPSQIMLQQLLVVARDLGDDKWLGWLLEFPQEDNGFPIYASAQPFVR